MWRIEAAESSNERICTADIVKESGQEKEKETEKEKERVVACSLRPHTRRPRYYNAVAPLRFPFG